MKRLMLNKRKIAIGLWLFFLLALVFIIANGKNMIVGYTAYQHILASNFTLDDYGREVHQLRLEMDQLKQSQANLSAEFNSTELALQKARVQVGVLNKSLRQCESQLEMEKKNITGHFERQLGILNSKLEKAEKRFNGLRKDYDELVSNTAKSVCCKQKLDNPDISYYGVDANKIVCSEDKGMRLECSFD